MEKQFNELMANDGWISDLKILLFHCVPLVKMLFYENDTSACKLILHYDFHVTVTQFTGSKKKKGVAMHYATGIELNY